MIFHLAFWVSHLAIPNAKHLLIPRIISFNATTYFAAQVIAVAFNKSNRNRHISQETHLKTLSFGWCSGAYFNVPNQSSPRPAVSPLVLFPSPKYECSCRATRPQEFPYKYFHGTEHISDPPIGILKPNTSATPYKSGLIYFSIATYLNGAGPRSQIRFMLYKR